MTSIVLAIATALIGLVTYAKFSIWSVPAAGTVVAVGIYGYLFAGKHYERFRFHTSVMKKVRDAVDRKFDAPGAQLRPAPICDAYRVP